MLSKKKIFFRPYLKYSEQVHVYYKYAGCTFTPIESAEKGADFTLQFTVDSGYNTAGSYRYTMNGQEVSLTPTFSGSNGTITIPNVQGDLVIFLYPNPVQYTLTTSLINCYCDILRNGSPMTNTTLYYGDVLTIYPVTISNPYGSWVSGGNPRIAMPTLHTVTTDWTTPYQLTVTNNVKVSAQAYIPKQTITFYEYDGVTVIETLQVDKGDYFSGFDNEYIDMDNGDSYLPGGYIEEVLRNYRFKLARPAQALNYVNFVLGDMSGSNAPSFSTNPYTLNAAEYGMAFAETSVPVSMVDTDLIVHYSASSADQWVIEGYDGTGKVLFSIEDLPSSSTRQVINPTVGYQRNITFVKHADTQHSGMHEGVIKIENTNLTSNSSLTAAVENALVKRIAFIKYKTDSVLYSYNIEYNIPNDCITNVCFGSQLLADETNFDYPNVACSPYNTETKIQQGTIWNYFDDGFYYATFNPQNGNSTAKRPDRQSGVDLYYGLPWWAKDTVTPSPPGQLASRVSTDNKGYEGYDEKVIYAKIGGIPTDKNCLDYKMALDFVGMYRFKIENFDETALRNGTIYYFNPEKDENNLLEDGKGDGDIMRISYVGNDWMMIELFCGGIKNMLGSPALINIEFNSTSGFTQTISIHEFRTYASQSSYNCTI